MKDQIAPLSVVITTYKRDELLRECLTSLSDQDLPLAEVVVVDDGGPGTAKALVEGFGQIYRYVWQPNAMLQAARNAGIRAARNDWIAFLDDDDLWQPWRHRQLQSIIAKSDAPVITTDFVKFFDESAASRRLYAVSCGPRHLI